ncbi:hypothetical protein GCM10023205_48790 [Yinghuangia aomiensis]|uniref:Leucine rich repeat variant n=1 Tax=Yinghuangia aomiensis TaxID=676205 RepID=A0ABP9HQV6_9ACTN
MLELVAALRVAPAEVGNALAGRLRGQLVRGFAAEFRLPEPAAAKALGDAGPAELFGPEGLWSLELLRRTAAVGHPEASARLVRGYLPHYPELADAVFAAITDPEDPRWHVRLGVAHELELRADLLPLVVARGPFRQLAFDFAARNCMQLPYAAAVDLCTAIAADGADALLRLAAEDLGHDGLPELLRTAATAPDPATHLAVHRTPGEWTDPRAVALLLKLRRPTKSRYGEPELPDRELLVREHARRPFPGDALAYLARSPACPPELVAAALEADFVRTVASGRNLPLEVLSGTTPYQLPSLLRRIMADEVIPIERLLTEVRPARAVLAAMPYQHAAVGKALSGACAGLGDDVNAWLTAYRLLAADFPGSVAELVTAACADAAPAPWPDPEPAVFPVVYATDARIAFATLLAHAHTDIAITLAPHIDQRTAQHLLLNPHCGERLRGALLAVHAHPADRADHVRDICGAPVPQAALRHLVRQCVVLPWSELTTAVMADDLPAGAIRLLVKHPGCPREFAVAAANRLNNWHDSEWRGIGAYDKADFLRHAPHPGRAIEWLIRPPGEPRSAHLPEPCAEARALTARHLGDDIDAWTIAISLFRDFPGTLTELLQTARAAATGGR